MPKLLVSILMAFGVFLIEPGPLSAQVTPPTPEDLTLRPGDTITWTPSAPHKVRLGGPAVTHGGKPVALTPFSDVQKILTLQPALTADAQGIATTPGTTPVTATVKQDAVISGVPGFNFTCGFVPHYGLMVTVPFTITAQSSPAQPPKTLQIVPANGPIWILKTPQGDKRLTVQ
jgi:hypothetical protein